MKIAYIIIALYCLPLIVLIIGGYLKDKQDKQDKNNS